MLLIKSIYASLTITQTLRFLCVLTSDGDDEDDDGEVGEDVDEIESDEEETDNKTNGVAESMEH